jgi:hypothetical protein
MKIVIETAEQKFGKGQSNRAVAALLRHIAKQIEGEALREAKSRTEMIKNNGGETVGWFRVEIGDPVPGVAKCEGCGEVWQEGELDRIEDLYSRVSPGEAMPVGQCPDEDCGSVCHRFYEGAK